MMITGLSALAEPGPTS